LTQPDNLQALITFTGTEDESWFFMVSNAMEARAAPVISAMLSALEAIDVDDSEVVIASLQFLSKSLCEIGSLLERMDERCDPQVFYHQIRPFVAGSLNDHLPRGVFYDEGDGQGSWRKYRGGSNGQSSLIQFFDAVLGVVHEKTIGFHEVRHYLNTEVKRRECVTDGRAGDANLYARSPCSLSSRHYRHCTAAPIRGSQYQRHGIVHGLQ
jgi:indoleamine 2,3-dioxygenase